MLQTNFIVRGLTELSPRPWSLHFEGGLIRDAAGGIIIHADRHEDLDWLANAPELVEMLIHEIVRLQRHLRTPRRPARQLFQRETGGAR